MWASHISRFLIYEQDTHFSIYTQDARANEVDSGTEPEEDEMEATGSAEKKGEVKKKEDWGMGMEETKTSYLKMNTILIGKCARVNKIHCTGMNSFSEEWNKNYLYTDGKGGS